ncbi:hypothetical protein FHX09_002667 [Rhizobium sp. BK538]|nr:hypothetical protein [Rhizobium sp. BK538]
MFSSSGSLARRLRGGIARLRRSLRVQLVSWVVLTLAGAICVNLYLSFRSATAAAQLVADRTLLASARVIAEAVHVDHSGSVEVEIPPAALEMFDTGFGDQVFYRVTTPWGNLLSGYPDLPTPLVALKGEDLTFRDHGIRALMLDHPVVGLGGDGTIAVTVGVTHGSQYAIRRQLWLSGFANSLRLSYWQALSPSSVSSEDFRPYCVCETLCANVVVTASIRFRHPWCRQNCSRSFTP